MFIKGFLGTLHLCYDDDDNDDDDNDDNDDDEDDDDAMIMQYIYSIQWVSIYLAPLTV